MRSKNQQAKQKSRERRVAARKQKRPATLKRFLITITTISDQPRPHLPLIQVVEIQGARLWVWGFMVRATDPKTAVEAVENLIAGHEEIFPAGFTKIAEEPAARLIDVNAPWDVFEVVIDLPEMGEVRLGVCEEDGGPAIRWDCKRCWDAVVEEHNERQWGVEDATDADLEAYADQDAEDDDHEGGEGQVLH